MVEAKQGEEGVHFVEGSANDQLEGGRVDGHLVQVNGLMQKSGTVAQWTAPKCSLCLVKMCKFGGMGGEEEEELCCFCPRHPLPAAAAVFDGFAAVGEAATGQPGCSLPTKHNNIHANSPSFHSIHLSLSCPRAGG
jgi:hypothetical protein